MAANSALVAVVRDALATRGLLTTRTLSKIHPAAAPAVLPHLLADGAGDARGRCGGRYDAALRLAARYLEHQLGADRLLELFHLAHRHHESTGAADDAVL